MEPNNRRQFLRLATYATGAAATVGLLPATIRKALSIPAASVTGTIRDVEHVVILMQENRSFDHYFGTLRGVRGFADRHVLPLPNGAPVWNQPDGKGGVIPPFHLDTSQTSAQRVPGTPHDWITAQGAANNGKWDQWVPYKTQFTMGHYRRQDIPFQFALADAFTICDAYHCSIQGETAPNRTCLWAGSNDPRSTGGGPVIDARSSVNLGEYQRDLSATMQSFGFDANFGLGPRYTFTTYPQRLEQAGVSWKVYQDPRDNLEGLLNALVGFKAFSEAPKTSPLWKKGMSATLDMLEQDIANNALPQVSWICATSLYCEHPGSSSPIQGAKFIQRVLDALIANPAVWSRTALFITFDENDGFFDHVPPPAAPSFNPDGSVAGASTLDVADEIHFEDKLPYGLGPRVPMYVVSPWSKGGWVNSQVFDHTSVIRFLEQRFGVMEPNIGAWRRAVCGDLTSAFDFRNPHGVEVPRLPDTSRADAIVRVQSKLPVPAPPSTPDPLYQEPGIRPSRALPYSKHASCTTPTIGVSGW